MIAQGIFANTRATARLLELTLPVFCVNTLILGAQRARGSGGDRSCFDSSNASLNFSQG